MFNEHCVHYPQIFFSLNNAFVQGLASLTEYNYNYHDNTEKLKKVQSSITCFYNLFIVINFIVFPSQTCFFLLALSFSHHIMQAGE